MAKIDPIFTPIHSSVLHKENSTKDRKKIKKGTFFEQLLNNSKTHESTQINKDEYIDFSSENIQIEREQLDKVMEQIRELGKRVTTFKHYNDLLKYRAIIKNFISFYVKNSMEISMVSPHRNPFFNMNEDKKMIIHLIDQKLEELTINFLQLHSKPIELLKSVELIEGLIIDLQA